MKRVIIYSLTALLLSSLAFAPAVNADPVPFDEIKMVLNDDPLDPLSYEEVSDFGWDQTPYLYLKLPDNVYQGLLHDFNLSFSLWSHTEGSEFGFDGIISDQQEIWLSPGNWNAIKAVGQWDVYAAYAYVGGMHGSGTTDFTVSPEPVSSILFLLGATPLAGAYLKKRKR